MILTSGAEKASSSRDTFGFGYGHTIALIVRYDTRVRASAQSRDHPDLHTSHAPPPPQKMPFAAVQVRIHSSYGCTIRVGIRDDTRTGSGFFHGGTSVDAMPDCGPGSWIDLIPEDWRLLNSGKKRLLFDHTCGTVPLCTEPSPPPAGPAQPPRPSPTPSPPPYAPHSPPSPHSPHSPHARTFIPEHFIPLAAGSHLARSICRLQHRVDRRHRRRRRCRRAKSS